MFKAASTFLGAIALPALAAATEKQSVVIMAPPPGIFAAYVVATDVPNDIRATFANDTPFETVVGIERGAKVSFVIGVTNCKANPAGDCQVKIAVSSKRPDGSAWGAPGEVSFVTKAVAAVEKWALWEGSIDAAFDAGEPVGEYVTTFVVTDEVANQTRTVTQALKASEGGERGK